MSEISQVAKEKIQEAVLSYPDLWSRFHICAFQIFHRETGAPTKTYAQGGAACHGSVALARNEQDNFILVNAHKPMYQGAHPEFTKWVCLEGPFAHGVLNKDNEDELLNHASVHDYSIVGMGGVLWNCKALRYTVEDTFRLPMWYKLREQGLSGYQAFIGCSILNLVGEPEYGCTHNSLFGYNSPRELRKVHDEILNAKRIDNSSANRNGSWGVPNWGCVKPKTKKKPDGWGGFVEVKVPQDVRDFATQLREIFEGDPKNVK